MADEILNSKLAVRGTVNAHHSDYDANIDIWIKCRDVIAGSSAIKGKTTEYLPKLSGQDQEAYEAYLNRAVFFPAVKRTIKGMSGLVFMKKPDIQNLPDNLSELINDVDLKKTTIFNFAKSVFHEIVGMGRIGILTDMPETGGRPYFVWYKTEQIINWREEMVGKRKLLTLVVLEEYYEETDSADPFIPETGIQYRILDLTYEGENEEELAVPVYRMRVVREDERDVTDPDTGVVKKEKFWSLEQIIYPKKNGQYLQEITFDIFGAEDISTNIQDSPILDMVEVSISHYNSSADIENGRHWCGIPQPWLAGFPDKGEYKIGGDEIWVTSEPQAEAGMLEFTGQGLTPLENAMEEKEAKLAILGLRLLESSKKTAEQPETLRLRMLSDVSTLQAVVRTVSEGITMALKRAVEWMATATAETTVMLNLDYDESLLQSQDLLALVTLWQSKGISYKTLYKNLEKSEITREGIDADTEQTDIKEELEAEEELNKRLYPDLPINEPDPNADDTTPPADDNQRTGDEEPEQ